MAAPRDNRIGSVEDAKKKAARKKRVRIRTAQNKDLAAVASIFLPDELTGNPPRGKGGVSVPVTPGQTAKVRRGLSLGVGDEGKEGKKRFDSQPDNASTTRLRARTKAARAARKAADAERAGKVTGRYPGAGVTRKTRPGETSPLDIVGDIVKGAARGATSVPGNITEAPGMAYKIGKGAYDTVKPGGYSDRAMKFTGDALIEYTPRVVKGAQKYGNSLGNVSFGAGGPKEQDVENVKQLADWIVGPNLTGAVAGGSFNPVMAGLEGAMMFLPVKGLPSAASSALRAIIGTSRFSRAVREGMTVSEALVAAKFTQPVRPIRTARRAFRANEAEAWSPAAGSRTGRVAERAFDAHGRPVVSRVGVGPIKVKTERQKAAQVAQHRMKFEGKRQMLPGVQLKRAVGHYRKNLGFQYSLRSLALGIDPAEAKAFHAQKAVEHADDPQVRANHILHMEGWGRAEKWVRRSGDDLTLSPEAPQRLTRAWEALPESSSAREDLLREMGLLEDSQMEERLHMPGRVFKGAKYTPEEVHAMNQIKASPERRMIETEMRAGGASEEDIQTVLEQHDAIARGYWDQLEALRKDDGFAAERMAAADAAIEAAERRKAANPRDSIAQIHLIAARRQKEDLTAALEGKLPYDSYYRNLQEFKRGFPDEFTAGAGPNTLFQAEEAAQLVPPLRELPPEIVAADRAFAKDLAAKLAVDIGRKTKIDQAGIEEGVFRAIQYARLGADGKLWYEESAQRILALTGGNKVEAERIAQLIGLLSASTEVGDNVGRAMKAYKQWKAGETISIRKDMDSKIRDILDGKSWDGRKTNTFYRNMLEDIDPEKHAALMEELGVGADDVTVDRHIYEAFGLGKSDPSYYGIIQDAYRAITDQLGWEKPKRTQAAAWVVQKFHNLKARYPKWSDERAWAEATTNYSDALDEPVYTTRFPLEARPGSSDVIPEYASWSPEVQAAFLDAKVPAINKFFADIGLPFTARTEHGAGFWMGENGLEVNPAIAIDVHSGYVHSSAEATKMSKAGESLSLPQEEVGLWDRVAASLATALNQNAASWFRPLRAANQSQETLAHVKLGRKATREDMVLLEEKLSGDAWFSHADDGVYVARADWSELGMKEWRALVTQVTDELGDGSRTWYGHVSGYLEGDDLGRSVSNGRGPSELSDALGELRQASDEVDAAFRADPEGAAGRSGREALEGAGGDGGRSLDAGSTDPADLRGYSAGENSMFPPKSLGDMPEEEYDWWVKNADDYQAALGRPPLTMEQRWAWIERQLQKRRTAVNFPETVGLGNDEVAREMVDMAARGETGGYLSGTYAAGDVPNPNPLARETSQHPMGSKVFISERVGSIPLTGIHELTHYWQNHFPGVFEKLKAATGGTVGPTGYPVWLEDAVEAFNVWLLRGGAEQPVSAATRRMFQKTAAMMLREASRRGGMVDDLPITDELKGIFESMFHWQELTGGALRGAEDFRGGKVYTLFEKGLPRDLRHPFESHRAYVQSIRGLFGGKSVGKGYVDPSTVKDFRGYLIENGFYKADVTDASFSSLAKAVKMHTVVKARRFLLEASTEKPESLSAIPIYVDPTKNTAARKELAERAKILESLPEDGDIAKHIDLKGIENEPMSFYEDLTRDSFPSHIDGVKAETLAKDILTGVREPIENVRWVEPDILYEGDLFANPKAFFGRTQSWGQLEALGIGFDVVNDLMKLTILQMNPAYMGMNLLGNAALVLMQQGPFALMNLPRALALSREIGPDLAVAVDHYMGRGISQLSQTNRVLAHPSQFFAELTGEIVDKIPRRMAFLHEAWRKNYRTADDLRYLFQADAAQDDLYEIVTRANDAVIDYERLSPLERKIMTRTFFIYPWIKGATRFTFRFPMEHPVQAMAMAYLYERQQAWADENLGERPWYAEYLTPFGNPIGDPKELIPFGPAPSRVPTVERNGEEYPYVFNPKQLMPFTTPFEFAQALSTAVTGNPDWQGAIDTLQPLYPALITSLTGYDSFAQREVGTGLRTFAEQAMDIPIRDRWEQLSKTEEELAAAASNRLYPRNQTDELKKTPLGTLAPTPYNREKGEFYSEGKRGQTPEEKARQKFEQVKEFIPPGREQWVQETLQKKVEWAHLQDEGRKRFKTENLTPQQQAELMVELGAKYIPFLEEHQAEVKSRINAETAGPIRSEIEGDLGWNDIDELTSIANEKARADEARAEGAVVGANR